MILATSFYDTNLTISQNKTISKISVDSNLVFTSYARLNVQCTFNDAHCASLVFYRLLYTSLEDSCHLIG